MYFCLMNVIVNALILAFMNGAFSQFNFVQEAARFPYSLPGENPAKTHRKQAAACVINMLSMETKANEGSSTTSDSASTINTTWWYDY